MGNRLEIAGYFYQEVKQCRYFIEVTGPPLVIYFQDNNKKHKKQPT